MAEEADGGRLALEADVRYGPNRMDKNYPHGERQGREAAALSYLEETGYIPEELSFPLCGGAGGLSMLDAGLATPWMF